MPMSTFSLDPQRASGSSLVGLWMAGRLELIASGHHGNPTIVGLPWAAIGGHDRGLHAVSRSAQQVVSRAAVTGPR